MNFITEIREGFGISWAAIRANKLRSILTTLGIVIGIVTVTLMGTAIEGLNQSFMSSISSLGADVFFVSRDAWFNNNEGQWRKNQRRRPLKIAEANKLIGQLELSSAVAPVAQSGARVEFERRNSGRVQILGTTEQYAITSGIGISEGHFFSAEEAAGGRPVCIIGMQVSSNLFGGGSALGQRIKISSKTFEVVGVLEKQGSFMGIFSMDNQAVIPIEQFITTIWNNPDIAIHVKARQLTELEDSREELRHTMRKIRRLQPSDADDFAINQQEQFVQMFNRVAGTIAAVGFFITGLSLFVGGIGIMNIMFVSVAERTREIGIRKAIGAKRRTILLQFLTEAGCICLLGGLIALAIAWPLTLVMQKFLPATMSLTVASVALLVSLVTGVVSGFLPAWRAARMNPVDALRSE